MNNEIFHRVRAAFPAWWYSPVRDAGEMQTLAERTQTLAERRQTAAERTETLAEGAEDRRDTQGEEAYDPTPPRTPAPREGRPAIPASAQPSAAEPTSTALSHAQPAIPAQPSQPLPHSAMLSQRQPPSATLSYPCCRRVRLRRLRLDIGCTRARVKFYL